jgi:hypothetical protein
LRALAAVRKNSADELGKTKFQIPTSKFQTNSKCQEPNKRPSRVVVGWILKIGYWLFSGCWNLEFPLSLSAFGFHCPLISIAITFLPRYCFCGPVNN